MPLGIVLDVELKHKGAKMEFVKVAKNSDPKSVSKCIGSLLIKNKDFRIKAMGPDAVNNTVKSIAILRKTYSEGIRVVIKFSDTKFGTGKNEIIFSVIDKENGGLDV